MAEKVSIDQFVKEVASRLPEQVELVRNDKTWILGSELKLTGVTEFRGKPIQDDLAYELEVPVYQGKFEMHGDQMTPTIRRADHEQELRRAYLAYGLPGIYSYLTPYLSKQSLQRVKDTFMRVTK